VKLDHERGQFLLTVLVLAAVAALIYLFKLDASGFSMSEGHRVVPGMQMLQDHDWFMPHMFGQAYLRKPPGMPWAIAASMSLLGPTVFAARAVSALSMLIAALASAHFARRWFGSGAGLAAGLAQLLLPWFFESGRAAEIESLNNCATAVATWAAIDLLVNIRSSRPLSSILLCTLGVTVAALAKGPASLPVIVASCVAACAVLRTPRALLQPRVLAAAGARQKTRSDATIAQGSGRAAATHPPPQPRARASGRSRPSRAAPARPPACAKCRRLG
jgi:4-amino-4-deoxy-L-arabinose transferase-like glycosyltransferase